MYDTFYIYRVLVREREKERGGDIYIRQSHGSINTI